MTSIKLPETLTHLQHDIEIFNKINQKSNNNVLVKSKDSFYIIENKSSFEKFITLVKCIFFLPDSHVYRTRTQFKELLNNEIKDVNTQLRDIQLRLGDSHTTEAQKSQYINQFRSLQKTLKQAEDVLQKDVRLSTEYSFNEIGKTMQDLDRQIKELLVSKFTSMLTQDDSVFLKESLDFLFYIDLMEDDHFRGAVEFACNRGVSLPANWRSTLGNKIVEKFQTLNNNLDALKQVPTQDLDLNLLKDAQLTPLSLQTKMLMEFLDSSKNEEVKQISEKLSQENHRLEATIQTFRSHIPLLEQEIQEQKIRIDQLHTDEMAIEDEMATISQKIANQYPAAKQIASELAARFENFNEKSIQTYINQSSLKDQRLAEFMQAMVLFNRANRTEQDKHFNKMFDLRQDLGLEDLDPEFLYSLKLKDLLQIASPNIESKIQSLELQLKQIEDKKAAIDQERESKTAHFYKQKQERQNALFSQTKDRDLLNSLLTKFEILKTLQTTQAFPWEEGGSFPELRDASTISEKDVDDAYQVSIQKRLEAEQNLNYAKKALENAKASNPQTDSWVSTTWSWATSSDIPSLQAALEKAQRDRDIAQKRFESFSLELNTIKNLIKNRPDIQKIQAIQEKINLFDQEIAKTEDLLKDQRSSLEKLNIQGAEISSQIADLRNYAKEITAFSQIAEPLLPYLSLKQQSSQKQQTLRGYEDQKKIEFAKQVNLEERLRILENL